MAAKQPLPDYVITAFAIQNRCRISEICTMCGKKIETMAFQNTGVCCELCRKDRDDDHSINHAIIEAPQGGER